MIRVLSVDPGISLSGWAIFNINLISTICVLTDYGFLKTQRTRVTASQIYTLVKNYNIVEVLIEDFHFWHKLTKKTAGGHERKANYCTVIKMQKFISFLHGFLSARYVPVTIVPPRRWRQRVKEQELEEIRSSFGFNKIKDKHILSAIGMFIGEMRAQGQEVNLLNGTLSGLRSYT